MPNNTINKITASWEPIGKTPVVCPNQVRKMRKMQAIAFQALHDKNNIIINAPTASGKTLAICWKIGHELQNNPTKKAIISVPQTIIGEGFYENSVLQFVDEDDVPVIEGQNIPEVKWSPIHYLCTQNEETNISLIQNFLNRDGCKCDINDRVLICSHASLIMAFQKYPELFKNLIICVDEAHHIYYSQSDNTTEEQEMLANYNRLGNLISYCLNNEDKNIDLILSTATFFRGNRLSIIPENKIDKFTKFHYPMDEYLKDCHWLRGFNYDFAMYTKFWNIRLKEIFNDHIGKCIIYIPNVGNKYYSFGSKQKDVEELYKCLAGSENYEKIDQKDGLIIIKRGDKDIKIVNLVDDSDEKVRERRKKLIIEAHNHNDNSKIDVIITLNMFREGANWKWADREIIIGSKGSLTDMTQIIGRLLRDAKDKSHVEVLQLLPFSFGQLDAEDFRDNLNEYSKVIFATMLIEDVINPVKIKLPVEKEKSTRNVLGGILNARPDYLKDAAQDENKVLAIWEEVRNQCVVLQANGTVDFGHNTKETRQKFEDVVTNILKENGIENNHKEISEQIRIRWMRESIKKEANGIDLDHIDFDLIKINPLQFWLTYTSGMCGINTFKQFRDALTKYALPYEEAKDYVQKLGLKNFQEWRTYCMGGNKPDNIPNSPETVYKDNGWICWEDWLGVAVIRWKNKVLLEFRQARDFARSLKLKSNKEWRTYCRSGQLPKNIPSEPDSIYKDNGWISWGDWLETGNLASKDFLPFEQARDFVRNLNLKRWKDYTKLENRRQDIPIHPERVYKSKGWNGTNDWLGHKRFKSKKALEFTVAREFARSLGLKNQKEWFKYTQTMEKPENVPASPNVFYKDWISWGDWLGTQNFHRKEFIPFKKAREVVRELGLKNSQEWREYCKLDKIPKNIPINPAKSYKNKGWISMGDWIGTGFINYKDRKYLNFESAKKFVNQIGLNSQKEWKTYCESDKKPVNIPCSPNAFYKEWISWGDFLGHNKQASQYIARNYLPFEEAREFVRSVGLKNQREWIEYCRSGKKPKNISSRPYGYYKNKGWVSMQDWLGSNSFDPKKAVEFNEARNFVRALGLKNQKEWRTYLSSKNKLNNIPSHPDRHYKNKGWISWGDFLGHK